MKQRPKPKWGLLFLNNTKMSKVRGALHVVGGPFNEHCE